MGLFNRKEKEDTEQESIEEPQEEQDNELDNEQEKIDMLGKIKSMNEKQLLRLIAILAYEQDYSDITEDNEDLIKQAMED